MKLSKKTITIGLSATLAVALIATIISIGMQKKPAIIEATETQNTSTDMIIKLPSESPITSSKIETENTTNPGLAVSVNGSPQNTNNTNKTTPKDTAKPVSTISPTQPNNGIINIGNTNPTAYNCNTANHHCINADNHAYITNLEIQGCKYCSSHSCPSFYYVSDAGIPICNPSLCPQYDIKKDPIKHCQTCGRLNGNGDNNTCQKYIIDFTCPICGVLIKANECHTH